MAIQASMTRPSRLPKVFAAIAVALALILGGGGVSAAAAAASEGPASFQVRDHDIYGRDGKRFIVHGVIGFNRAFATFTRFPHQDWSYRAPTVPSNGISPPTGFLSEVYVDHATALSELRGMQSFGANLVRIFVEPAMFNTAAYTDRKAGLAFPPEPQILDDIVKSAASLGMVVQLQPGENSLPDAMLAKFVGQLAARYRDQWNVWLNTSNEPFSGPANSNGMETRPGPFNDQKRAWDIRIGGALSAIRAAGFRNPVVVDPLHLWKIQNVVTELRAPPFVNDPNLILGPHLFYVHHNEVVSFATDFQVQFRSSVDAFKNQYAIVIDAFGFNTGAQPMQEPVRNFVFNSWVPAVFNWLSDPAYDGITLFVWPPAYNDTMYLVTGQPGHYVLTDWGKLASKGYTFVGRGK
jgi:hypothetical protein